MDYQETFTLTVYKESLRMFLTLMTLYNLELHQMNVKAVYLLEELNHKGENIYMCVLKGVTVMNSNKIAC